MLFRSVEDKGVKLLMHEEMFHLPFLRSDVSGVAASDYRQGEDDALLLEFAVAGEVEDEVIEQFIGSLGDGSFLDYLVKGVGGVGRGRSANAV